MEKLLEKKKELLMKLKEVEEKIELIEKSNLSNNFCKHEVVYQYIISNKNIYQCKRCRVNIVEKKLLENKQIIRRKF